MVANKLQKLHTHTKTYLSISLVIPPNSDIKYTVANKNVFYWSDNEVAAGHNVRAVHCHTGYSGLVLIREQCHLLSY